MLLSKSSSTAMICKSSCFKRQTPVHALHMQAEAFAQACRLNILVYCGSLTPSWYRLCYKPLHTDTVLIMLPLL